MRRLRVFRIKLYESVANALLMQGALSISWRTNAIIAQNLENIVTTPQLFGQLSYTPLEEKSIEFVMQDVTAAILHMGDYALEDDDILEVDTLSSLRVFVPVETSLHMGEMDLTHVSLADKKRIEHMRSLGFAPVYREQHLTEIRIKDQVVHAHAMLKPCDVKASRLPKLFRKLLGEHKLVYQMSSCGESDSVQAMLGAVKDNGMENLAWIDVHRMEGIIGTINDEWYIAPSSYGVLGLEGTVVKLNEDWQKVFWPGSSQGHTM